MYLRILHVIETVNPKTGGPIEGVLQQAKAHAACGHMVEIVSNDSSDITGIPIPNFQTYFIRNKRKDSIFYRSLYTWVRSNCQNYDCVIVNGIWGFLPLVVKLALDGTDIPYFVFTHGMLDPWFKRKYPLKHLKKWLVWPWAVYPALRDAEAVFFTCEQEKLLARQSFWLYDCHESVIKFGTEGIPNPNVDCSTLFLEAHPLLLGKRIFLFLGRVHIKKGPDLLVKTIVKLKKEGLWDSDKMRLVFAGPNDNSYAKKIKKLSERVGVSNSIYWTGMVSGNQKWGAFQSAEAFVLPSHQENFGIAVAEALSCGTPVMISTAVNIAEFIKNDCAGLVQQDTLDGTYKLFQHWFALSTADKASMAIAARNCFKNRFHISLTASSIQQEILLALLVRSVIKH